jgi:hypothetical protein
LRQKFDGCVLCLVRLPDLFAIVSNKADVDGDVVVEVDVSVDVDVRID